MKEPEGLGMLLGNMKSQRLQHYISHETMPVNKYGSWFGKSRNVKGCRPSAPGRETAHNLLQHASTCPGGMDWKEWQEYRAEKRLTG